MSKFKTSWLAILGLILSIAPIVGAYVLINVYIEVIPPNHAMIDTVLLTVAGIFICLIVLAGTRLNDSVNKGAQVAAAGLFIGGSLFVLFGITFPGFVAMEYRARESDVKSAAHFLQTAVEDYKKKPERKGLKPGSPAELSGVVADFLPENVREKENPFDKRQRYGAGGIVFGSPGAKGQIGYIVTDPGKPYQIIALGRVGTPILTLQEEP
jgi:hypothetical protein